MTALLASFFTTLKRPAQYTMGTLIKFSCGNDYKFEFSLRKSGVWFQGFYLLLLFTDILTSISVKT